MQKIKSQRNRKNKLRIDSGFDQDAGERTWAKYRYQEPDRSQWRHNGTAWDLQFTVKASFLAEADVKPYHTGVARRPIPGTSTPWRTPTPYYRRLFRARSVDPYTIVDGDYMWNSWYKYERGWASHLLHGEWGGIWERFYRSPEFTTLRFEENAVNRVETQALNKLGSDKANIAESLATARSTADMLANAGSRLLRGARAARRRDFKGASEALGFDVLRSIRRAEDVPEAVRELWRLSRNAGDLWLEYNYGWKPLMMDIHGIYELMYEQIMKPALLVRGDSTVTEVAREEQEVAHYSFPGEIALNRRKFEREMRCVLVGKVSDRLTRSLARMGLDNPAQLAWELVPLSFVIDWAFPIGDILSALSAPNGLDFVSGSLTNVTKMTGSATVTGCMPAEPWKVRTVEKPGLATYVDVSMERQVYNDWPRPTLYEKSPFSTSHVLSALALFRQNFR